MTSPLSFDKNDKWLLASHLQKSIRRGLENEAAWAAHHLYDVDRAYLAYRLSVIAVEDVGAGDPDVISGLIDFEKPWGARRFCVGKNEEDQKVWEEVAQTFAGCTKDRTPCDWMSCVWWLNEFEQELGPWIDIDPQRAVEQAYQDEKPWWWRGLMAWRAAGTKMFPSDALPETDGVWPQWVEAAPESSKIILQGFGARQREAHPVFFPLAIYDQQQDKNALKITFDLGPVVKSGPWILPALDKHTSEGKRLLQKWIDQKPRADKQPILDGGGDVIDVVGKMMFWLDGGRVDKMVAYSTQKTMDLDIKKRWLIHHKISGRWLFDTWGDLEPFNQFRLKTQPRRPGLG